MPIASSLSASCSVIPHHLRESALQHKHSVAFRCPSKLADNVWLLCGCSEKTRVHQVVSALVKDDGELLVESNLDLVANVRDVDGLILRACRCAANQWQQQKGETCGF